MLTHGPAKRVTIYVTEGAHYHHQSVHMAVLHYLFSHGVTDAVATRGIAGFGADHHMHSINMEVMSTNLPVKVEFLETAARVDELLPALQEMAPTGLIEIQDTTIVKLPRAADEKPATPRSSHMTAPR